MKTLLIGAAITMMTAVGYSQGTVVFGTTALQSATNIVTGQRVPTGPGFLAQLYYGGASATEAQLISVTNAPVNFAVAGRIIAGTRYTDPAIVAGGATGTFQIRAWESALGANYETAFANYSSGAAGPVLGKSALFQVVTGNPNSIPPGAATAFPASLNGFYLTPVPEPTVIALGALGLAALLYRRRK